MPLTKFRAINSLEGAAYLDGLEEERPASAGIAIHMAWLEHSSSFELFKGERLLPESPVDMLLLYKAAAATFESWPIALRSRELLAAGRVMNRQEAEECLRSVTDPLQATLAFLFMSHVISMSTQSSCEQDLHYLLELFLRCIQQEGVIERIASGEIKRKEAQMLADPDYW
jgi:hypothetical protein